MIARPATTETSTALVTDDALAWAAKVYANATLEDQEAVSLDQFQQFVVERSLPPEEVKDVSELFLISACCAGNAKALAYFRSRYLDPISGLRRMKLSSDELEDAKQRAMVKLLVPDAESRIKLQRYGGLGNIGMLVRVVVAREALNALRANKQLAHTTEANVADAQKYVGPLEALRRAEQESLLKTALGASLKALTPRDQNLIRMHLKDGVTLETLAKIHGVHKTTVVRWLLKARAALFTELQKSLRETTGMGASEVRNFALSINSRMNLSLSRLFGSEAEI